MEAESINAEVSGVHKNHNAALGTGSGRNVMKSLPCKV